MRRLGLTITCVVFFVACADSSVEVAPSTTSTTATTSTTTTAVSGPIVVEAFETGGVGGSGQTVSPRSMVTGEPHRFEDFQPAFAAVPPSDHWAIGVHSSTSVLFEWTGENGQRPGSLYVMLFDGASGSVDEAWTRLESGVTESLDGLGFELEWIDRGSSTVGDTIADWRELRTPAEVIRPGGWPCVISLPSGCVWTDATARFYVVPLGQATVTIAVYENRCDCEVGDSYSKFARGANELHDWTELFESFLASMEFNA